MNPAPDDAFPGARLERGAVGRDGSDGGHLDVHSDTRAPPSQWSNGTTFVRSKGPLNSDLQVKRAVYRHFAEHARRPAVEEVAEVTGMSPGAVAEAYARLRAQRVLVLEAEELDIRMAPPFSGIPTQHVATIEGRRYFANCAWDVFGIAAALQRAAHVESTCGGSGEPLVLSVDRDGPPPSEWLFHCPIPAVRWWDDIVFT